MLLVTTQSNCAANPSAKMIESLLRRTSSTLLSFGKHRKVKLCRMSLARTCCSRVSSTVWKGLFGLATTSSHACLWAVLIAKSRQVPGRMFGVVSSVRTCGNKNTLDSDRSIHKDISRRCVGLFRRLVSNASPSNGLSFMVGWACVSPPSHLPTPPRWQRRRFVAFGTWARFIVMWRVAVGNTSQTAQLRPATRIAVFRFGHRQRLLVERLQPYAGQSLTRKGAKDANTR